MAAVNSWQDENRGAEVSERERQHIHPFYAQRVSDGGIRSINTRNHHALAASGAFTSIPELSGGQSAAQRPKYHAPATSAPVDWAADASHRQARHRTGG